MSEYGKGYIAKSALLDAVEWDNDLGKWVIWDDDLQSLMTQKNDVVEIVRCKDCGWAEFYETSEAEDIYECNFWNGEHYGEHAKVDGSDYCIYGSRR